MNSVEVSFVIPTRNGNKTIRQCIESILKQTTHLKYEIIVVDNNNYKSLQIDDLPVRVVYESRKGRSFARNMGIQSSLGEWIAFIDCDVILDSHWLSEIYLSIMKDGYFEGGQGKIIPYAQENSLFESYRFELIKNQTKNTFCHLESARYRPHINTAACIYRKSRLIEIAGFNEQLSTYEDADLTWRLWHAGCFFKTAPKAIARVSWPEGKFIKYLFRAFNMGMGSYRLNYLWGLKVDLLKFNKVMLKYDKSVLNWLEACRVLFFISGMFFEKLKLKFDSKLIPINLEKNDLKNKKFIFIENDNQYWIIISPRVRLLVTSSHLYIVNLQTFFELSVSLVNDNLLDTLWNAKDELIANKVLSIV